MNLRIMGGGSKVVDVVVVALAGADLGGSTFRGREEVPDEL